MKREKVFKTVIELIFNFLALGIFLYAYKSNMFAISFFLASIFISIFGKDDMIKFKIYDKRYIKAFIISFAVYIPINLFCKYGLNLFENINQDSIWKIRLFQLITNCVIFLCIFAKLSLREFNWKIKIKWVLYVVIIYLILFPIPTFILNSEIFINNLSVNFFLQFLNEIFYPSIVEEILFRGFLLTGMISLGIKSYKANIIQSVIFGSIHIISHNEITILVVLSLSGQIFLGYLLGKVYLKSGSLSHSIILHALLDASNF